MKVKLEINNKILMLKGFLKDFNMLMIQIKKYKLKKKYSIKKTLIEKILKVQPF